MIKIGNILDKDPKKKPSFEEYYATVPVEKNDTTHYNLRDAFDEFPFKEMEKFAKDPNYHLGDRFKLSTHPTFSDESKYHSEATPGGHWTSNVNQGKEYWQFTPSQYNIDNMGGIDKFREWWATNEPDAELNINRHLYAPNNVKKLLYEEPGPMKPKLKLGGVVSVKPIGGKYHSEGGNPTNINGLNVETQRGELEIVLANGTKVIANKDQQAQLNAGIPLETVMGGMPQFTGTAKKGLVVDDPPKDKVKYKVDNGAFLQKALPFLSVLPTIPGMVAAQSIGEIIGGFSPAAILSLLQLKGDTSPHQREGNTLSRQVPLSPQEEALDWGFKHADEQPKPLSPEEEALNWGEKHADSDEGKWNRKELEFRKGGIVKAAGGMVADRDPKPKRIVYPYTVSGIEVDPMNPRLNLRPNLSSAFTNQYEIDPVTNQPVLANAPEENVDEPFYTAPDGRVYNSLNEALASNSGAGPRSQKIISNNSGWVPKQPIRESGIRSATAYNRNRLIESDRVQPVAVTGNKLQQPLITGVNPGVPLGVTPSSAVVPTSGNTLPEFETVGQNLSSGSPMIRATGVEKRIMGPENTALMSPRSGNAITPEYLAEKQKKGEKVKITDPKTGREEEVSPYDPMVQEYLDSLKYAGVINAADYARQGITAAIMNYRNDKTKAPDDAPPIDFVPAVYKHMGTEDLFRNIDRGARAQYKTVDEMGRPELKLGIFGQEMAAKVEGSNKIEQMNVQGDIQTNAQNLSESVRTSIANSEITRGNIDARQNWDMIRSQIKNKNWDTINKSISAMADQYGEKSTNELTAKIIDELLKNGEFVAAANFIRGTTSTTEKTAV